MEKLIKEKQQILIDELKLHADQYAIFGIPKEIAGPLIKTGILHKDTYKFTGGCALTKKGRV